MLIAIVGCLHGELDNVYENIKETEGKEGVKIELLICCGDFQSTRNIEDLRCMAVPIKYQNMCSFYKYYSGEKVAPVLTIFIGGNHEASNYLQELPYGGWVAPNIFYLGYAGVVNYGGLRICGISGIYKGSDYMKGHFEKFPYSESTKRSVYHVRNLEVFRLKQLTSSVDIMISHDWPKGIYEFGDKEQLLRHKPFFRDEIERDELGSEACKELLHEMKPAYWLAAHLHTKFVALVPHKTESNSDEKEGDVKCTRFLALDKCVKKRRYLQLLNVPNDESKPKVLEYDLEWLTILFLTNHLLSVDKSITYMPGPCKTERWIFTPSDEEKNLVLKKFGNNLKVPENFVKTAEAYSGRNQTSTPQKTYKFSTVNPQTSLFCSKLSIDDPVMLLSPNDSSQSSFTDVFTPVNESRTSFPEFLDTSHTDFSEPATSDLSSQLIDSQVEFSEKQSEAELSVTEQSQQLSEFSPEAQSFFTQSQDSESQETAFPMKKKFKRRNFSLYNSSAEEIS